MKKIQKKISKGIGIALTVLLIFMAVGCAEGDMGNLADQASVLQEEGNGSADAAVSAFSVGESEDLAVQFLDVGQGSSALVRQGDTFMLIDGGDRGYSSFVVSYLKQQGITELEYIIVSHYDADHLNGIIGVLNVFDCKQVLAPDYETDTKLYQSFQNIIKEKGISIKFPKVGDTYSFASSSFSVVSPVAYGYADSNSNSLGIRISYGENSFLICGDCTEESEQDILYSGIDVKSDVFAANHHGSKYSNDPEFLEAVNPSAVVISCGRDNQYGHPDASVLSRVQALGADLYRTDLQGTITAVSNGMDITFENEVCMDYRSGTEMPNPSKAKASGQNESEELETSGFIQEHNEDPQAASFIVNKNTKKFHLPDCSSVGDMEDKNKEYANDTRENIIGQGYDPCKRCNP